MLTNEKNCQPGRPGLQAERKRPEFTPGGTVSGLPLPGRGADAGHRRSEGAAQSVRSLAGLDAGDRGRDAARPAAAPGRGRADEPRAGARPGSPVDRLPGGPAAMAAPAPLPYPYRRLDRQRRRRLGDRLRAGAAAHPHAGRQPAGHRGRLPPLRGDHRGAAVAHPAPGDPESRALGAGQRGRLGVGGLPRPIGPEPAGLRRQRRPGVEHGGDRWGDRPGGRGDHRGSAAVDRPRPGPGAPAGGD